MDAIEALVRGLPGEPPGYAGFSGAIRSFRTVCEDYRDCLEAAARFGSSDPPDPERVEEYRELAAELLAEAAAMLKGDRT